MSSASDFVIENGVLNEYTGPGGDVVIPEGVTTISGGLCYGVFSRRRDLERITIPASVTEIQQGAFYDCYQLRHVKLLGTDTVVRDGAFEGCVGLEEVDGFAIVGGQLVNCTREDEELVIPEGVTGINSCDSFGNEGAFRYRGSIVRIHVPKSVKKIQGTPFYGFSKLKTMYISPESIGEKMFGSSGKTIELVLTEEGKEPKRIIGAFRKEYYAQSFHIKKDCLLPFGDDIPDYDKLVACGKHEGFQMNEDGRMQAMLFRLLDSVSPVAKEHREMFADFLAGKIAKALKFAEERGSSDYVRALIEVGAVTEANKKKVLKALNSSSVAEIQQLAATLETAVQTAGQETGAAAGSVDKKYLTQLKKIKASAVLLKSGVEQLPDVLMADGSPAPKEYLQLILAEYIAQYKKKSYVFADLADEAAAKLDRKNLSDVIVTLYRNAAPESIQLTFLPVLFRYADGSIVNEVYRKYAGMKWMTDVLNRALLLSDTREAMLLADKNRLLNAYAAARGTDSDYIRYTCLYDFGFDAGGKKIYDLGSTKLEVTLNRDLALTLYDTAKGKVVKSLPKKEADPDLYAAASADFSEIKKNLKKAVSSFVGRLFQMFLDGTTMEADQWSSVYLNNPILRQAASLLVWSQGGKTFTLSDGWPVDCAEQPFAIGTQEIAVAHPMEMTDQEISSWQKYYAAHTLKQPFAQVWEPVIDCGTITEDRYCGIEIPAYRFKGQEKHGITFQFDFGSSSLYIDLDDCTLDIDGGSAVGRHDLNLQGNLVLGKLQAGKSRASNHIISLLDKWTIYGRILKDDVSAVGLLQNATLAQIADYLNLAAENNCTNCTAALLEYQRSHFTEFDPMAEFTLDL